LSGSVVYNQETGKNDTCQDLKLLKTQLNQTQILTFLRSTYIAKKDLPAVDADQLFNLPPGSLWPYVLETTMPFQNRWAKIR
jgi:peptidyl-prolyl cis-trans isomerase D